MFTKKFGEDLLDVSVHTAPSVTIPADSNVNWYSNRGATGTVRFNLPPAKVGMSFSFMVEANQRLEVDPYGTETITLSGVAQGAGSYIYADAVGECMSIVCLNNGTWTDFVQRGTWTAG